MWAITSYFNPQGYRRRLTNYRSFRENLKCPLLTVEWSVNGHFELCAADADIMVRVIGGDWMWQKECLLNIAVRNLPADCNQVAWLDCDIVFEDDSWVERASDALALHDVVQLYDRVAYLDAHIDARAASGAGDWNRHVLFEREGGAAFVSRFGGDVHAALAHARTVGLKDRALPSTGFAWAASRAFLEDFPLFDVWVVGGGDVAFFWAAAGAPEHLVHAHGLTAAHQQAYFPSARRLARLTAGNLGIVPGRILTLWHGNFENRQYSSRHQILRDAGYDPEGFLERTGEGVWRWRRPDEPLSRDIRRYFVERREDDRCAGSDAAQAQ